MKEQNREITEIERMAIDIDKRFYEAEIKQTLPKKHPSIVKAEALYNAGYRKQKEGEWLPTCDTHPLVNKYECSCCGEESMRGKYCPNCGAHMRGGKNE